MGRPMSHPDRLVRPTGWAQGGAPVNDPLDTATTEFARHREMLFAIVYNLLGTVADTEDVLEETWLSWTSARGEHIGDVRAYLARIAVNAALSRLRRARHEAYVG